MAKKKNFRVDGTYLISTDATENPKLGAKVLSSGKESLYLEYYFGYKREGVHTNDKGQEVDTVKIDRHRESLKLYLWQAPRTPEERQQNKETLELAKQIRFERSQQLLERAEGYRLKKDRQINFFDYYQNYIDSYTKKDIRVIIMAFNRFKAFLCDTPEYRKYASGLRPEQLTKAMMEDFADYIKNTSKGFGITTIWKRFKKVINQAREENILLVNPCKGVKVTVDENVLTKDILSQKEIETLINTTYEGQNQNIRRAFILSLYSGLRFCDVKDLTFANVDYSNKLLKFDQNKTAGHSKSSFVVIPLNDGLLKLIGKPSEGEGKDTAIFPLPSHTMCLKALRHWVKRAGIDKHITWHCARHSFAVNILNNGANIKTVSSLLGHSSLVHTEKYVHAVDELKKNAINSLPELNL